MRKLKIATFLFIFFQLFTRAFTQTLSADELINAWKVKDTSQTTKAEITYEDLRQHINKQAFNERINFLNNYILRNKNNRLETRIILYAILGKMEQRLALSDKDIRALKHAIELAGMIGDEQLLSEVYTLYAENFVNKEEGLFYLIKAIDIQRKIGYSHFPKAYLRLIGAGIYIFHSENYKACLAISFEGLNLLHSAANDLRNYVLLIDMIGASYKELGLADSVIYYYTNIKNTLQDYTAYPQHYRYYTKYDSAYTALWNGIASGGIANGLFLKGKYNEADPLFKENIKYSLALGEPGDASLAQYMLGKIQVIKKNQDSALFLWKQAYILSLQNGELLNATRCLHEIYNTYISMRMFDSALLYNDKFHFYKDSLQIKRSNNKLESINTQIEYEDMQAHLQEAKNTISNTIRERNYILIAIFLLMVISLLLYNRNRLRQNVHREKLEKEKAFAEAEAEKSRLKIEDAQKQIELFTKNILEKSKLIEKLQSGFTPEMKNVAQIELQNFTILTEDDWLLFKFNFEKVYTGYLERLNKKMPGISPSEQRFMTLAKIGLTNKEMAAATGVSPQSIRVTIFRLKKKFNLSEMDDIHYIAENI